MKLALTTLFFASTASAFAPATPSFGVSTVARSILAAPVAMAGGDDDDEEGLDLNLEEMFDM